MSEMDLSLLRSKFRGSMLGALIGDCLGCPYQDEELLTTGMKIILQRSFDKLEGPMFRGKLFAQTISHFSRQFKLRILFTVQLPLYRLPMILR